VPAAALALAVPLSLSWVVSATLSIEPHRSWLGSYVRRQGAVTELTFIVFFLLVASHLRRREQWLRAAAVLVTGSVPLCVFAVFQSAGMDPMPWHGAHRVGSLAGNPVFLAAYLVLVIPVTAGLLATVLARRSSPGWLRPGVLAYALVLQAIALLLSGSRGPALALAVGLVFLGLATTRAFEGESPPSRARRLRRLRQTLVAVTLLGAATLGLVAQSRSARQLPLVGRFATALDPAAETTRLRLDMWRGAAARLVDPMAPAGLRRSLFGHGPETFSLAFVGVAPARSSRLGELDRIVVARGRCELAHTHAREGDRARKALSGKGSHDIPPTFRRLLASVTESLH
jgi:hypothetical protein